MFDPVSFTIFYYSAWAIFGAIMGSFLNVVALRYNTGKSLSGRSACAVCAKKLSWHELIPIVSYIALRGRCAGCSTKISLQYFLAELGTASMFVVFGSYISDIFSLQTISAPIIIFTLVHLIILCLMIVIVIYDIRHKIIPDGLVYGALALSVVPTVLKISSSGQFNYYELLSGIVVALPLFALWAISRGAWMGFGDVKLALVMGYVLGITLGFSAVLIAFYIGALVGIVVLCLPRSAMTLKSELPFAPFLILGMYIVLFTGLNVFNLIHGM